MPRKKTKRLSVEERRLKVAELVLEGKTYRQIKEELGVSIGTVSGDVNAITDEWRREYASTNEQRVAAELAELLSIREEAQQQWEASKNRTRRKVKRTPMANGELREEQEVITLLPDVKFLETRRAISGDIRKLFGLDKPGKVALTDPTGEKEYEGLSEEELKRRLEAMLSERNGATD